LLIPRTPIRRPAIIATRTSPAACITLTALRPPAAFKAPLAPPATTPIAATPATTLTPTMTIIFETLKADGIWWLAGPLRHKVEIKNLIGIYG
jgi:hypothetical protein